MKRLTLTLIAMWGLLVVSSGAGAWQSNINGTVNGNDRALAVTVDRGGNAIAAGFTRNASTGLDDFTIIKSSGVDGAELWRQVINGTANGDDQALAVAVGGAGNVIAAGFTTNDNTGRDFTVIKFDGASGAELWRQVINGTANGDDQALAVAVGDAGNVIAAGFTTNNNTGSDFTVIKFNGASGAELWRQVIDGTTNGQDQALAVTVGGAGNVIAAGFTTNPGTGSDFTVLKFSGTNGTELWRRVINGTRNDIDQALGVAVGPGGNVVAAGFTTNNNTNRDFTVIKFNGPNGAELWRQVISGSSRGLEVANSVTVDDAGDVVVAGHIDTDFSDFTFSNFTVIKFNGAKGTELWRQQIGALGAAGVANAVAVDGARNVIATGFTTNPGTGSDFMVIKFDGASGAESWRQVINGTASGQDQAVALKADAAGNVVAAGFTQNSHTFDDFTIVKLFGVDGAGLWSQAINSNTTDSFDTANGVTVDGSGDVVAVGFTGNSRPGLIADFTVIKFSGADGAELWGQVINGTANGFDQANAVTVDGAGDVVTAGVTENTGTSRDFTVIKLSGVDGIGLWSQIIRGSANGEDAANAVTIDVVGDVVAAGFTANLPFGFIGFTVIKLAGVDGTELWRQVITGATGFGLANAVTLDGAGDVVAAGVTRNIGFLNDDFTVVKFSGSDGTELWRQVINGTASNSLDQALAIIVDPAGDVIAAGLTENTGTGIAFTVIKFSGVNGTELWRRLISGGVANAVTVDGAGDVVAAGRAGGVLNDFTVIKFSGVDGTELWRQVISGTATNSFDQALKVTVDGAGDAVAGGFIQNSDTGNDFTVVKFSGLNGAQLWRQVINGTASGDDRALAVTVDQAGDVVAAGKANNSDTLDDFTVVKLRGTDGSDFSPSPVANASSTVAGANR